MSDINELQVLHVDDINDYELNNHCNLVLIEIIDNHDFIGKEKQFTYSNLAKQINEYESAPSWGNVVKIPERLYFNPSSVDSLEWETKQELCVGDKAWFQRSMYLNAPRILTPKGNGKFKEYVLIRYSDIYLAKRDDKVLMLNGFLLVKPNIEEEKCLFYKIVGTSLIKCKIVLVSDPVNYKQGDEENLKVSVGDDIILDDPYRVILEESLFSEFSSEIYYIIQRREIAYVFP